MNLQTNFTAAQRAGSYMAFVAGRAHYALPVEYVRYITSMDAIKPRMTPDGQGCQHRVFDFEGHSLELHRFSDLVGANSLVDECAALSDLLQQRRQDHIDWLAALENSILTGAAFTKATDPNKCAFGRWFDQYQSNDAELRAIMLQFEQPHCRIHALAQRLLSLAVDEARVEEAIQILNEERHSTLQTLLALFDQADGRLREMVKPVALIVDLGRKLYALELDVIEDIHDFSESDWLPDSDGGDKKRPVDRCYDGFFQKGGGKLYLKVDPFCLIKN